ncbi:MOSC domain-containing protein [Spirosoma luteum]|uniref:MOSC domain-containing protein n=1 Tax=Spirosoma luteum TaxID=431553 RepID=UPI000361CECF|nr:MOSC N-terminal beta barrel domain-containing protein [Spirosoma luteum]
MITVSHLYIYPIKSLSGILLQQATLLDRGFQFDRRWMLVTPDGNALTQHRCPQMALLDVAIDRHRSMRVWHRHQPDDRLTLPLTLPQDSITSTLKVHVWDSHNIPAVAVSHQADHWFSRTLGQDCRLVFMPDSTVRAVDPAYAHYQEAVSFADGYPFLLIGQGSLDALNERLTEPVSMLRFRPNIVVRGSEPHAEDTWERFRIGDATFYRGESCGRCVLTTIDPLTAQKGPEPLRTLTSYRQHDHKLLFGQYVLAEPMPPTQAKPVSRWAQIRVGQPLTTLRI